MALPASIAVCEREYDAEQAENACAEQGECKGLICRQPHLAENAENRKRDDADDDGREQEAHAYWFALRLTDNSG